MTEGPIAAVLDGSAEWCVLQGDCREVLATLPAESCDSCVTDPPYEIGMMLRNWDRSGVAFDVATWAAVFRVLKPGAHLLAFGGTRTWHRIACAIEDAGFEIRDSLAWVTGQGFPKSLDVSKAIDRAAGAERAIVGSRTLTGSAALSCAEKGGTYASATSSSGRTKTVDVTAPATDAAKQWSGFGTSLKPAFEPVIVARKPLVGTVAANVLQYGTGALNIDGCRIAGSGAKKWETPRGGIWKTKADAEASLIDNPLGRWPANIAFDEHAAAALDAQSGNRPGMSGGGNHREGYAGGMFGGIDCEHTARGDSGGASRFFFCPKASREEREAGLQHFRERSGGELTERDDETAGLESPRAGAGRNGGRRNCHPTVKPLELIRYLCRLVTPPGGVVLSPFTGSGTDGAAATLEGFRFIGAELNDTDNEPFASIARARISHVEGRDFRPRESLRAERAPKQCCLFEVIE